MSKKPAGQHSQTNRHAKSGQHDVVEPGRRARSGSAWTQIAADPDAAPALDAGWLARAERVQPERIKKEAISLRVDADVLAWFKAQGVGYQSRMNSVLRAYAEHAAGGSERLNLLASAVRTADDEE